MHYNALRETTQSFTPKLQKLSLKTVLENSTALKTSGVSQDNLGMMSSRNTRFGDFWFGVRTYESLKTSKLLGVTLLDPLIIQLRICTVTVPRIFLVPSNFFEPSNSFYGQGKNRACVCFGESARGANECIDCSKTGIAGSST